MKFNFVDVARAMRRQLFRHIWSTTQQKWTTSFVIGGLALASVFMPTLGIAVAGTAFAGWWVAVGVAALLAGLVGNRVGVGREKAALLRQTRPDQSAAKH